ncbi:glycosyltransferase family 2 protein [Candidatus Woesebacteria bacterium]|nr:MAG: glycosyltransferase family 2 protein [Candidatus Woesebacteria bacterium]
MKNKIPKVAIIILNWNKPGLTLECLESLDQLQVDNYKLQVIVVDNASSDDSKDKLSNIKLQKAAYKLLVNKENYGFAKGNNIGIKYAIKQGADYLVLLNNDTKADSKLIVELLREIYSNPSAGILSPKIYFAKGYEFHKERYKKHNLGKVIWAVGGNVDWNNIYGTNRGVDEVDTGQFDEVDEVDFASGACLFVKAEVIKKVGMFDEKYYMYLEDMDFSERVRKAGFQICFVPKAVVWHKVSQSSQIGGYLNDYFISRNRLLFAMKYASSRTKFAIMREAVRLLVHGRKWQKIGIKDYVLGNLEKGSWN